MFKHFLNWLHPRQEMGMGMMVRLIIVYEGSEFVEKLRNVTEMHWHYPSLDGERVAFESDIHGTGITYYTSPGSASVLYVKEFEVRSETGIANCFVTGW